MDSYTFSKITSQPEQFFKLLPEDWQNEIVPFWKSYTNDASIYGLYDGPLLIGGGIVFYTSPPHFEYFEREAKVLFSKDYHYLGFIWINENYRNKNLGTFWLNKLKSLEPHQDLFLLTEEEHLHHFYTKNGFFRIKEISNKGNLEWLYVSERNLPKL